MFTERYLERAERGLRARPDQPAKWQRVTGTSQFVLHVTPQELEKLNAELIALLARYHERVGDPARRPRGARTVEAIVLSYLRDDA